MKRFAILASLLLGIPGLSFAEAPKNTCITCHAELEGELSDPVKKFEADVHRQAGLSCADCHGGDRNDESMDSMSPAKGFRGFPKKAQVPEFCARCHSDVAYMHRFNPKMRTDQLSQYVTSVHGQRLKQGDKKVAACIDCHSVHNIRPSSDTRSPVHPTNVAATCSRCHGDPDHMKDYHIPTDQARKYAKSVHAKMIAEGDLSAPTCSTCHGNHGATPPGVNNVANVCGTCHVVFQELYEKSPHKAAFAKLGLPGCVQCHSNHDVIEPAADWVGTTAKSVCTDCHVEGDNGYAAAGKMAGELARLRTKIERANQVLAEAEYSGMEVSTPRVELVSARDALVKARRTVHSFDASEVKKLTDEGVSISEKSYQAGVLALYERDLRRKGLGVALIIIAVTITGLYLKIRQMESNSSNAPIAAPNGRDS
jgi:nitrate/TMAO reductase-like tetraheme cytochrome c subunit